DLLSRDDPPDLACLALWGAVLGGEQVELAAIVLTEREDEDVEGTVEDDIPTVRPFGRHEQLASRCREAVAPVTEHGGASQVGGRRAAVHEATGGGDAEPGLRVA